MIKTNINFTFNNFWNHSP